MTDLPPPTRRLDPVWLSIGGIAVGLVLAGVHRPQLGMFVVAGALLVAALLRLTLRPRVAGSLVVRNRRTDVLVLAVLATAIAVLAAVTPFPSSG